MAANGAQFIGPSHYGPIPIVDLSYSESQANIVILVYTSFWLGALAWEVLLTTPFDYRLLVETNWRSFLSAIHSLAYFLSRYATLLFIVLFVHQEGTRTDVCDQTLTSTAAIFSLSVCAINLVFMLRTISIWNMRSVAVAPLTISWLIIVGFSIALSVKAKGTLSDGQCSWATSGFYVGAMLVSVAIFGLLCLFLTVLKLKRQSWREVLRGLLPQSKPNLDSADVTVMLVQRTTVFFVVQFALIILVSILYFVDIPLSYQLMNFVAFKTVTSSTAGKIFRKSWKLTRHVDNGGFTRPPSYYPGWAEENDEGGMLGGTHTPPNSSETRKRARGDDDVKSYVEGEFHGFPSSTKSILGGARTPAQAIAAIHGSAGSTGGPDGVGESVPDTVVSIDALGLAQTLEGDFARGGADSVQRTPTFVTPTFATITRPRSAVKRGRAPRSRRSVRPQTEPSQGASRQDAMKQATEMKEMRPCSSYVSDGAGREASSNVIPIVTSPALPVASDDGGLDETSLVAGAAAGLQPSTPPMMQTSREDLNHTPSRSRLWLDSRAERARMEASASGVGSPTLSTSAMMGSTGDGAASHAPSVSSSSRTNVSRPSKRVILDNANEAGEMLNSHHRWTFAHDDDVQPASSPRRPRGGSVNGEDMMRSNTASTSRAAFLPSPAIVSQQAGSRLDRRHFDFDVIRQSLQAVDSPKRRVEEADDAALPSQSVPSSPLRPKPDEEDGDVSQAARRRQDRGAKEEDQGRVPAVRPKTAPSRPSSEKVAQVQPASAPSPPPLPSETTSTSPNALDAFRQVLEDDDLDRKRGIEDAARPRTSRGGRLGAFGHRSDLDEEGGSSSSGAAIGINPLQDEPSSADDRPTTSHGGPNLKPFGLQGGTGGGAVKASRVSAIEEQYKRLAAYVDGEPDSSQSIELERVESRSTMENLA